MKKTVLLAATIAWTFGTATLTGCGNDHHEGETHEHHEGEHEHPEGDHDHSEEGHQHDGEEHDHDATMQEGTFYYCPMKCEGDKTYEEEGSCPVCGMDLEKKEE